MNITLIGMPTCGKSTVGVLLAKALEHSFIDTDLVIQKKCQMSLQKIIDTRGLDTFLKKEEEVLLSLDETDTVIATGGSAVYSEKAMQHLKKDGCIVYIRLPFEEIEKRLVDIKTRGVAMVKGTSLHSLFEERTPLYEKWADVIVDPVGLSLEETVEQVIKKIKEL